MGVAKLRNQLFVLSRSFAASPPLCTILVFEDRCPFKLQQKLEFKKIRYPRNIDSVERDNCLYVTDSETRCIWKISPEERQEDGETKHTLLESSAVSRLRSFTVTVTNGGQILIVNPRRSAFLFCESEFKFCSPDLIKLPIEIDSPYQVVENSEGNFIFLHRTYIETDLNNDDLWNISEVSRNGNTIIRQVVGIDKRWLAGDGSVFLCVDPDDRVFLADTDNGRLILLDSCLRFISSFLLKDGKGNLLSPRKIFYDDSRKQLLVIGNQVIAYKLCRL